MRNLYLLLLCLMLALTCAAQQKKSTAKGTAAKTTTVKPAAGKSTASKPSAGATKGKSTTKKPASNSKAQSAQRKESKEVKGLRDQQRNVKQKIKEGEQQLADAKKDAQQKQQQVEYLEQQVSDRVAHIRRLEQRIDSIDGAMTRLESELEEAERSLKNRRDSYANTLRHARAQRSPGSTLWFIISADTWQQRLRRARYARQFAGMQRLHGQQIMEEQERMRKKQGELLAYKSEMASLLQEIALQRTLLMQKHRDQQQVLDGLKAKQDDIASNIEKQRRQLAALDKKIDEVIAREIEEARKAAEERERRRKAAEEAARRKALAEGRSPSGSNKGNKSNTTTGRSGNTGGSFTTAADVKLTGSFEQNKGRLPVPITGEYHIQKRMGMYTPTEGVTLDNKGVDYVGRKGCSASAVFDGTVTAVVYYGGMTTVLMRHGLYITVYCNLSSVRVNKGQAVKARELIGTVAANADGEYVLHFQVRKETKKLNPEDWVKR